MSGEVQAPAPSRVEAMSKEIADTPVDVKLLAGDALRVGLTLTSLARSTKIPREAAAEYERVGKQMIAAASSAQAVSK